MELGEGWLNKHGSIRVRTVEKLVWVCGICGKEIPFATVDQLKLLATRHLRNKHKVEVEPQKVGA